MSSGGKCADIPANLDVAGIGIRISMYVTTLVISLVPRVEETEELRRVYISATGPIVFGMLVRVHHYPFHSFR